MTIRRLPRGEEIPTAPPRRYMTAGGYVVLRWRVAKGQYVEVFEHRVANGRVVDAAAVHHINHDRSDNRPENLQPMPSHSDHGRQHATTDRAAVVRMYLSGLGTKQIARTLGTFPGNISRILAQQGVPARSQFRFTAEEELEVVAELTATRTARSSCQRWGISKGLAHKIARKHGVAMRPGRPPASAE